MVEEPRPQKTGDGMMGFSSVNEPRRRAPPWGGRGGGRGRWVGPKRNLRPGSIVFSLRLARARVSLSCESACRAQAGAVCVKMLLFRVRSRLVSYPGVTCVEEHAGISIADLVV